MRPTRQVNHIEFVSPPGAVHTCMFKDARLHAETLKKMDAFFSKQGFITP